MAEKSYDTQMVRTQLSAVETTSTYQRRWWILANVSIGTFMANLDSSIASVALPTLSAEFQVSIAAVQWVMSAYLLTICALLPIAGKLSDIFGRGRLYNIGFFVFAFGSAVCAMSFSFAMLISAKVLQAFGAVLVMANTQAIVATTFKAKERGRALGIAGITVSLGVLSGPALGGFLIEHLGWSSIFWVNVPIGLIGFIAGLWIMPKEKPERSKEPFDYIGSILFVVGMVVLLYSVSGAETKGWLSTATLSGIAGSIVLLGLFYFWEVRNTNPMLDFSLYKIRMFLTGSVAAYLSAMAMYCVIILMPFFLQDVMLLSPEKVGYLMAAYPLMMAITAPIAGWLSDRIGSYVLTSGGLVVIGLGFVALTFLPANASLWVVAGHLAIFGVGHGMFQPSNNSSLMGAVPHAKVGLAGGLNALTRNFGMLSGISFAVSLFTYRLHVVGGQSDTENLGSISTDVYTSALNTVFWAAALICAIGAVVSMMRGKSNENMESEAVNV